MIKPSESQRGVALIVVLLIVAVIAILATEITSRNHLSVRRTLNLAEYDQAYWYALSAEELVKKVIKQDLDDSEGLVHLQQHWAQADVVFPVENGQIAGKISDMRSCFNLNGLSAALTDDDKKQKKRLPLAGRQFAGMLASLGMDPFTAEQLAVSLRDYVASESATTGFGSGDAAYESRDVAYRAAKTLFNHRSELRAVLGFNQEIYLKIAPYVCAIPGEGQQVLNVNTVSVEQAALLAGMLENKISVGEAENIINQRPLDGYETVDEFWQLPELNALQNQALLKSSLSVKSDYFLLDGGAKVDEAIFRLQSVMQVGQNKIIEVLARQYGGQQ